MNAELVKDLFDYRDGELWWRECALGPHLRHLLSRPAGCAATRGYRQIGVKGANYLAHRLIWAWHHREWPINHIDHIDGQTSNNRIDNLREATRFENLRNSKKPTTNTSGLKGVSVAHGKYRAQIRVNQKVVNLGCFDCAPAAYLAYCIASDKHHGEFANQGTIG